MQEPTLSLAERPAIDPRFHSDLTAEDELGVVVCAHIHIEASVIEFVCARVLVPDALPRLQYEPCLRLAVALGLDAQYLEALKLLGDIRNTFSHNLNASLTDSKINELFSKLPFQAQELVQKAYVMTIEQRGEMYAPPFSKLSPKDRFILVAVVLKSFVVARAHEANSIQNVP